MKTPPSPPVFLFPRLNFMLSHTTALPPCCPNQHRVKRNRGSWSVPHYCSFLLTFPLLQYGSFPGAVVLQHKPAIA